MGASLIAAVPEGIASDIPTRPRKRVPDVFSLWAPASDTHFRRTNPADREVSLVCEASHRSFEHAVTAFTEQKNLTVRKSCALLEYLLRENSILKK